MKEPTKYERDLAAFQKVSISEADKKLQHKHQLNQYKDNDTFEKKPKVSSLVHVYVYFTKYYAF